MLFINKNWFYNLSDINSNIISIESWVIAVFFDDRFIYKDNFLSKKTILDISKKLIFELWENSKLEIYGLIEDINNYNLEIIFNNNYADLKLRYLLLSWNNTFVKAKIKSIINSSFIRSNMKILSIVQDLWQIDIDWTIDLKSWNIKVSWFLQEENIFLWDTWKISWTPNLFVSSNDVELSHSCSIEKISNEKLFYLYSRWISKDQAISIILESKIRDLFACLFMFEKSIYDKLIDDIMAKIYLRNIWKTHYF